MDIDKLSKLKETNYFTFVAETLGSFKKLTQHTLETLHDEKNDILIVDESDSQLGFQFRHNSINYCNGSFDFDKNGKVINFRVLILPVGFFNKRIATNNLAPIVRLFTTIAKHTNSELIEKAKKSHYELHLDGLVMTAVLEKNMQNKPYVSTWCEYES
jgi:hypothetical protein